jgi:hypothetical protein
LKNLSHKKSLKTIFNVHFCDGSSIDTRLLLAWFGCFGLKLMKFWRNENYNMLQQLHRNNEEIPNIDFLFFYNECLGNTWFQKEETKYKTTEKPIVIILGYNQCVV